MTREGPPTEQRAIYTERRLLLVPLPATVSHLVRHQSSQQMQLEMTNCLGLKSSNQPRHSCHSFEVPERRIYDVGNGNRSQVVG